MDSRNNVLDGSRDPPREWAILRVVWHIEKRWESAALYAAKEITQSSVTARLLPLTTMIDVEIHGSREKSALCDAAYLEIL